MNELIPSLVFFDLGDERRRAYRLGRGVTRPRYRGIEGWAVAFGTGFASPVFQCRDQQRGIQRYESRWRSCAGPTRALELERWLALASKADQMRALEASPLCHKRSPAIFAPDRKRKPRRTSASHLNQTPHCAVHGQLSAKSGRTVFTDRPRADS